MGKYDKTEAEDMQIVKRVAELAEKYNCKMSQIAMHGSGQREFYRLLLGQPKRSIWMIQPEHLTLN